MNTLWLAVNRSARVRVGRDASAEGARRARRIHRFAVVVVASLGITAVTSRAHAGTIQVDTVSDTTAVDGTCSLREAMIVASTNLATADCPSVGLGDDTILVPAGLYAVGSPLQVQPAGGELVVVGAGRGRTIVDGGGNDSLIYASPLSVDDRPVLTIEDLTLRNAKGSTGGAVIVLGGVTGGSLTLRRVEVQDSEATTGGGITVLNADAWIEDTTVRGCNATEHGGAIYVAGFSPIHIERSTFVGNSASQGGAVYVGGETNAVIVNCTATGNTSRAGAAIASQGPGLRLSNSTVVGNTGWGLSGVDGGLAVWSSIVSGNSDGDCAAAVGRDLGITSLGFNLFGVPAGCGTFVPSDVTGTVMMGPLVNNGGETATMAPLAATGPIDAGRCTTIDGTTLATDQRGAARPSTGCDIGAVEFSTRLTTAEPEPMGANCTAGGVRFESGADANTDASLDGSEIESAQYVCSAIDGADGLVVLLRTTDEPAGLNCPNGGQKVESGLDANVNSLLDPSEIGATTYVCNGVDGVPGTDGIDGTNGTNGAGGCSAGPPTTHHAGTVVGLVLLAAWAARRRREPRSRAF